MNFAFSEEQEELRKSVRRFLEDKSPESEVRRLMETTEGYDKAVWALRETNGVVEEVTDDELMQAKRDIDRMGIGCEPASATTLAGVRKLKLTGQIVCVLTGHVLKDPDAIEKTNIIEIEPAIDAVERALSSSRPRPRCRRPTSRLQCRAHRSACARCRFRPSRRS